MSITTHRMQFPLSREDALRLRAGDLVILDGEIVITAGLPTHQRLIAALGGAEPLPMDLRGQSMFHLGSYSREVGDKFKVEYINPTTSTRFNPYMPTLIRELQLHAVGGKGGLDSACAQALREVGGVYLSFLGGGCALLSAAVKEVIHVGWPDMLIHYRLVRLRVEGLGPVTVGIDAHGNSCFDMVREQAADRLEGIMNELAVDRAKAALPS
ncbi:fumarate hydratase C-terminal domain-containing protein [Ottowia thiooxydans]|uniref:fumarate hydratase C-terminal domain-containing protein n=1 Tax=Ottowia thiooxydans TaxID=219182 RepID=UPI0003FBF387|nr:fumarate hydratase C-terminal domain-containing protein [Ottowia thiooxydans]